MGKVHGSLSRAGKVRAATPKVEKLPKKRLPIGRARKRMIYKQRLIDQRLGGGGGKMVGPNNQAARKARLEKAAAGAPPS